MKNEETILQLLQDLKHDQKEFRAETNIRFEKIDQKFEKIDQRFEKIDERFEKIDQRFEKINEKFEKIGTEMKELKNEIRTEFREDRSRLNEIYDSRHQVEYKMTRDFVLKNIGWNAIIIIVGIFLAEAILR